MLNTFLIWISISKKAKRLVPIMINRALPPLLVTAVLAVMTGINAPDVLAKVKGNILSVDLTFEAPVLKESELSEEYTSIEMTGASSLGEPGEPVLPIRKLMLLVPEDKEVKSVSVITSSKIPLDGTYQIEPGQTPYPLSLLDKIKPEPDKPKPEIYSKDGPYHSQRHKFISQQNKKGYPIAALQIYPVEYNPKKGTLAYYENMTVVINLKDKKKPKGFAPAKGKVKRRTKAKAAKRDQAIIEQLIDNPEDIREYEAIPLVDPSASPIPDPSPSMPDNAGSSTTQTSAASMPSFPAGDYDYVIITSPDFVSAFEPLRQYRQDHGLSANTVTTDWIYANYPNGDDPAKIRAFITDAYNNWGTEYVLLGGDADKNPGGQVIVPVRGLSATANNITDIDVPADLYYACLDGSYDHNNNGIYGESDDGEDGGEVDLLAEVYVGRAPADSVAEVNNFVNKTLWYENTTNVDYLENNYIVGEWVMYPVDGNEGYAARDMEELRLGSDRRDFVNAGFLSNVTGALDARAMYAKWKFWSASDLIAVMNAGPHLLHHEGHALNDNVMRLHNNQVDALTNTRYFMAYSQGCYSAAFDNRSESMYVNYDSVAEHFTVKTPHGAFAYLGNSRYGYMSISQYFHRQFVDALFGEGIHELGRMNQDSKEDNLAFITMNAMKWCYLDVNLLGDPALAIKTPNAPIIDIASVESELMQTLGQSIDLTLTLKAYNEDVDNVSATISTDDPNLTIENNSGWFGLIGLGQNVQNTIPGFTISLNPSKVPPYESHIFVNIASPVYNKQKIFPLVVHAQDEVAPQGTISINNGDESSDSLNVTLTLEATDEGSGMGSGAQMKFSNDGSTWSAPEDYATNKVWSLTESYGNKTVFVQFKDAFGNWSAPTSDSIYYGNPDIYMRVSPAVTEPNEQLTLQWNGLDQIMTDANDPMITYQFNMFHPGDSNNTTCNGCEHLNLFPDQDAGSGSFTSPYINGEYEIRLLRTDLSQGFTPTTVLASNAFTVVSQLPIKITQPYENSIRGEEQEMYIIYNVRSAGNVNFYDNDVLVDTVYQLPGDNYSYLFTGLTNGEHVLKVVLLEDASGDEYEDMLTYLIGPLPMYITEPDPYMSPISQPEIFFMVGGGSPSVESCTLRLGTTEGGNEIFEYTLLDPTSPMGESGVEVTRINTNHPFAGIPLNGMILFADLTSHFSDGTEETVSQQFWNNPVFEPAILNDPVDGTTLNTSPMTFHWDYGISGGVYHLTVSSGPDGTGDVYFDGDFESWQTQQDVSFPLNGQPLYASLRTTATIQNAMYPEEIFEVHTATYTRADSTVPPVITAQLTPESGSYPAGSGMRLLVWVADPDGDLTESQITGLPPGVILRIDHPGFKYAAGFLDPVPTASLFTIHITATDAAGHPASQDIPVTVVAPPPAPTGLTATAEAYNQVALQWNAISGAAQYAVYRNNSYLATVTTASYTDNSVQALTSYSYKLRAATPEGHWSDYSNAVTVTTPLKPPEPSPSPIGLHSHVYVVNPCGADMLEEAYINADDIAHIPAGAPLQVLNSPAGYSTYEDGYTWWYVWIDDTRYFSYDFGGWMKETDLSTLPVTPGVCVSPSPSPSP